MGLNNWLKAVLAKLFGVSTKPHAEPTAIVPLAGPTPVVQPAEPAPVIQHHYSFWARFIFQGGHYRKLPPAAPKPNAFLPHPSELKTSAIWTDDLADQEVWSIGDLLGQPRNQQPEARADLHIAAISEAQLTVESDPTPHPRHFNLCGWPVAKDEQKSIALLLCKRSTLMQR
jgi:hypothetical protein